jgi:hypothetical protein
LISSVQAGEGNFPLSIKRLLEAIRSATERSAPETYLVVVAEAFDRTCALRDHLQGACVSEWV